MAGVNLIMWSTVCNIRSENMNAEQMSSIITAPADECKQALREMAAINELYESGLMQEQRG